jgi:hypothetical protein
VGVEEGLDLPHGSSDLGAVIDDDQDVRATPTVCSSSTTSLSKSTWQSTSPSSGTSLRTRRILAPSRGRIHEDHRPASPRLGREEVADRERSLLGEDLARDSLAPPLQMTREGRHAVCRDDRGHQDDVTLTQDQDPSREKTSDALAG